MTPVLILFLDRMVRNAMPTRRLPQARASPRHTRAHRWSACQGRFSGGLTSRRQHNPRPVQRGRCRYAPSDYLDRLAPLGIRGVPCIGCAPLVAARPERRRVRCHPVAQAGDWGSTLFAVSARSPLSEWRISIATAIETFGPVGIAVFAAVGSLRLSRFPSTNLPAGCPSRRRYGMRNILPRLRIGSASRCRLRRARRAPRLPCFSSSPRPYSCSSFSSWRQAQNVIVAGIY